MGAHQLIRYLIAFNTVLFLQYNAISQYIKFPLDTNHYWREQSNCVPMVSYITTCDHEYRVVKDTLIGSYIYKKMVATLGACTGCCPPCYMSPKIGYLRQDTIAKKVMTLNYSGMEVPLYNFNKVTGDTAKMYEYYSNSVMTVTINLVDSVLLGDGLYHKRFFYGGSSNAIEGVGAWNGLFTIAGALNGNNKLVCSGRISTPQTIYGGTCAPLLVESSEKELANLQVYPNPSNRKFTIKYPADKFKIEILNSLGELVSLSFGEGRKGEADLSFQPNGIYFIKIGSSIKKIIKE